MTTTRTAALAPSLPVKARFTRRSAIGGTAAAALGLAAGVGPATVQAQPINFALLDLARSIPVLVARCADLADKVATTEDAIPFDLTPDAEAAEVERLGLPALRSRQDRAQARLDRTATRLAGLPARTPAEVAAKSGAVVAVLGPDLLAHAGLMERYTALDTSALREAAALGDAA